MQYQTKISALNGHMRKIQRDMFVVVDGCILLVAEMFNELTSETKPLQTRTGRMKLLRFVDLYPKKSPTHICYGHNMEIC